MECLGCNKCYQLMDGSRTKFIMTQCGHIFCEQCLPNTTKQCPQCATIDFTTITLAKSPKLEAMVNYFSPTSDFIELSIKAIKFHDEQLAITLRGAEKFGFKYTNLKASYVKMVKDIRELSIQHKKLEEASKKLDMRIKEGLDQLSMQESRYDEERMEIDYMSDQGSSQRFGNLRQSHHRSQLWKNIPSKFIGMRKYPETPQVQIRASPSDHWRGSTPSGKFVDMRKYLLTPQGQRRASPSDQWRGSTPSTSNYRYNPSSAFSKNSWASTNSSLDSGTETIIASPAIRRGDFLVPSIQKVPKSVASLQKSKRALQALRQNYNSHNSS